MTPDSRREDGSLPIVASSHALPASIADKAIITKLEAQHDDEQKEQHIDSSSSNINNDNTSIHSHHIHAATPLRTATMSNHQHPHHPPRPSLLAISSARGTASGTSGSKGHSTSSSTSVTTIAVAARTQRSSSNAIFTEKHHRTHRTHNDDDDTGGVDDRKGTVGAASAPDAGPSSPNASLKSRSTTSVHHPIIPSDREAINPGPSSASLAVTAVAASIASGDDSNDDDVGNDDDIDDDIDAELVSWPLEGELDPRTMLREQLRRSDSAKRLLPQPLSPSSTKSKGKGRATAGGDGDDDVAHKEERPIRRSTASLRTGLSGETIPSPKTPGSTKSARSVKTSDASAYAVSAEASIAAASASASASASPKDSERRDAKRVRLRPRRYFVLTSAGKPVFASQPNWRKRRKQQMSTQHQQQQPKPEPEPSSDPSSTQDRPSNNTGDIDKEAAEAEAEEEDEDSEEMLTSLVGVIQAIISLYAVENDMIRYIDAGDLRIAFYLKAPIYLVAVSDWGEPESVLRTHLEYLYLAIISITTQSSIASIFSQRSNYDLRRLLAGTDNMLNHLLDNLQETGSDSDAVFEVVSSALRVVPFLASSTASLYDRVGKGKNRDVAPSGMENAESLRDECTKALRPPKKYNGILYAVLVSHSSLVTLLRPKDHSIYPSDLHILLNTLSSTKALRAPNSESWIPICLPRFNAKGFLHAFISYFDDGEAGKESNDTDGAEKDGCLKLGVLLITADKEGFFDMKTWKDSIVSKLLHKSTNTASALANFSAPEVSLYMRLRRAIVGSPISSAAQPGGEGGLDSHSLVPNIAPIRHFWYKSKTYVQIFTPYSPSSGVQDGEEDQAHQSSFGPPYADSIDDRRRLVRQYLNVHEALHNPLNRARGDGPAKLVYMVSDEEAVLGMATPHYEVYLCLPPLVPKKVATEAAHALTRWIRRNERLIFLTSSPSF